MITAERVSVTLDDAELLAPVSFRVEAGESLAVTGPNGSGKTTLLRVIAGLTRPTEGALTVRGISPDERRREFRSLVATLVGTPPLARNLTLREHLVLVGASWGDDVSTAEERADGLLQELGIARLSARFPHELSSGQTQLFTLALTLSRPFDVLLLDEPEQRLDGERLLRVGAALRARIDEGTTVVFTSHSTSLVTQVADRTLPLAEGDRAQHP